MLDASLTLARSSTAQPAWLQSIFPLSCLAIKRRDSLSLSLAAQGSVTTQPPTTTSGRVAGRESGR